MVVVFLAANKYNLITLRLWMSGTHSGLHSSPHKTTFTPVATLGAAPLGASLVEAVHDKLKSVGANPIVLQGQPTEIYTPFLSRFTVITPPPRRLRFDGDVPRRSHPTLRSVLVQGWVSRYPHFEPRSKIGQGRRCRFEAG